MSREEYNDLSRRVIQCAIEVHKGLGPGLLERVYENTLEWGLTSSDRCFCDQTSNLVSIHLTTKPVV